MIKSVVRKMPRSWVRSLGRIQFKVPLLRPVINYVGRLSTKGVMPIAAGPGKGLLFDNNGGFPGYSLGTTEPEEQEALARETKQGMCIYNVGANIGFHAVILSRLVGPSGSIICFEPFPDSAVRCARNLSRNGFEDRSMVVTKAVSDCDGSTELVLEGGAATFRLPAAKDYQRPEAPTVTVETCTLDGFVQQEGVHPPDIITIDIEGAEIAALRGAGALVQKHRPLIFVELHWLQDELRKLFLETLEPLGYKLYQLSGEAYRFPNAPCREHILLRAS